MTTIGRVDRLLSVALTLATVVAAALLVEQRINRQSMPRRPPPPKYLEEWQKDFAPAILPLSDRQGKAEVIVFTDFQCPFCRVMDSVLNVLERRHPDKISRFVVHFPLPGHPFARAAAELLECSARQGRPREMHDALYSKQEVLGQVPWSELATDARLTDAVAFARCVKKPPLARIEGGIALARKLRVSGTPAVVINGWLFDGAAPSQVEAVVDSVLIDRSPHKREEP